jgi:hypothetical protein
MPQQAFTAQQPRRIGLTPYEIPLTVPARRPYLAGSLAN